MSQIETLGILEEIQAIVSDKIQVVSSICVGFYLKDIDFFDFFRALLIFLIFFCKF